MIHAWIQIWMWWSLSLSNHLELHRAGKQTHCHQIPPKLLGEIGLWGALVCLVFNEQVEQLESTNWKAQHQISINQNSAGVQHENCRRPEEHGWTVEMLSLCRSGIYLFMKCFWLFFTISQKSKNQIKTEVLATPALKFPHWYQSSWF